MARSGEQRDRLLSDIQGRTRSNGHKIKHRKLILFKHKKKLFYCDSGQTMAQVTVSSCGVSILMDIKNLT